ncbi:MAG: cobyrinate a,c-diamide synthase [Lachnospiraceae bacterium]|nr:cobyrinate a,c-diamide synthase [Lachnospiraceae bacterium]
MSKPRIMFAAPKSGSGKTVLTCAFLQIMKFRGIKARSMKCGPDYIDPMFHRKVLGIPARNVDLFFTNEEVTKALFHLEEEDYELTVMEGVMGLYDGLAGVREEASSYHMAKTLKLPIVLIVNAKGMGRSVLAEIAGFLSMDHEKRIRGVLLNQVIKAQYEGIAPLIEKELGIEALGYFAGQKEIELESRYLGLKLPFEIDGLRAKVIEAAKQLEESARIDRILQIAEEENEKYPYAAKEFSWLSGPKEQGESFRIGVAMDEAFCFYYEDNFRLLKNAGAEIVFFSPLHDKELPSGLSGILLGGGYPEMFAKELSENVGMRNSIKNAICAGMPSLAECGGFMYLHEALNPLVGEAYPMIGVVSGSCKNAGKLIRFGYCTYRFSKEFEQPDGAASEVKNLNEIQAHEFHYFESTACGEDCTAEKPVTGKSWACGYFGENHFWSFGHLYYPSNPGFAKWFAERCKAYRQ